MTETLNDLLHQIGAEGLIAMAVTFLATNAGAIIFLIINIIRGKAQNYELKKTLDKAGITLNAEAEERMNKRMDQLTSQILAMCDNVEKRLKLDNEEKKATIEANAQQIDALIEDTRKSLYDDELTETPEKGE